MQNSLGNKWCVLLFCQFQVSKKTPKKLIKTLLEDASCIYYSFVYTSVKFKLLQQKAYPRIVCEQETMETKKMDHFPLLDVSVEVKSGNPDYRYPAVRWWRL